LSLYLITWPQALLSNFCSCLRNKDFVTINGQSLSKSKKAKNILQIMNKQKSSSKAYLTEADWDLKTLSCFFFLLTFYFLFCSETKLNVFFFFFLVEKFNFRNCWNFFNLKPWEKLWHVGWITHNNNNGNDKLEVVENFFSLDSFTSKTSLHIDDVHMNICNRS